MVLSLSLTSVPEHPFLSNSQVQNLWKTKKVISGLAPPVSLGLAVSHADSSSVPRNRPDPSLPQGSFCPESSFLSPFQANPGSSLGLCEHHLTQATLAPGASHPRCILCCSYKALIQFRKPGTRSLCFIPMFFQPPTRTLQMLHKPSLK